MSSSEIDINKLVIRRATPADKESVLRIHDNVHDGHDYLPAYYDHFISSSDFTPLVMIYDGETVGFEVIQVVDDGQTQIRRAARVNPKYEHKGLITHFNSLLNEWRIKNGIRRTAFCSPDVYPAFSSPAFQKRNKLVLAKFFPLYCVNIKEIQFKPADIIEATRLQVVSDDALSFFFKTNEIKEYLSPQNDMIVDMVPLKMAESNIPYMKGPDDYTTSFSDIRIEDGKYCGLLSFGTTFKVQRPTFQCNLDIFGTDTRSLKAHIVRNLTAIKSKVEDALGIFVLVQEDFNVQEVDSVFEDFGIKRTIWFASTYPHLKYSKICSFSREFHQSKY